MTFPVTDLRSVLKICLSCTISEILLLSQCVCVTACNTEKTFRFDTTVAKVVGATCSECFLVPFKTEEIMLPLYKCLQCLCLQCFDAVGWVAEGHKACKKTEWWGTGMVICLE